MPSEADLVIADLDFIPIMELLGVKSPVIFLTSECQKEISKQQISNLQKPYDFLHKPFTKDEVLNATSKILKKQSKNSKEV